MCHATNLKVMNFSGRHMKIASREKVPPAIFIFSADVVIRTWLVPYMPWPQPSSGLFALLAPRPPRALQVLR